MKKLILVSGLGLCLLGVGCKDHDGDRDVRTNNDNRQLDEREIKGAGKNWNDEKVKDRVQGTTDDDVRNSATGQQVRENTNRLQETTKRIGDNLDSNPDNNHGDLDGDGKK